MENTHRRYRRRCESGVFERIFKTLSQDSDNEYMMLDATIVRAHQHSAGAIKKGGRSSHRAVPRRAYDQDPYHRGHLGKPGGHRPDRRSGFEFNQAAPLLEQVDLQAFIADKAYDGDALIDALKERNITPVIPSKANQLTSRDTDFALYRERNLVERSFDKLKNFRAIATRYDKLSTTLLAAVHLVAALILLN